MTEKRPDKFFIKFINHVNNTEYIVAKVSNNDNYLKIFDAIALKYKTDDTYAVIDNSSCKIYQTVKETLYGYIYNSEKITTKLLYEFTLIKVDLELTEYVLNFKSHI